MRNGSTVRRLGAVATVLAMMAMFLVAMTSAASAEERFPGSGLTTDQTFFVYGQSGEYLDFDFTSIGGLKEATFTVLRPDGSTAYTCTIESGTTHCQRDTSVADGRLPIDATGVWTIDYDDASDAGGRRHTWAITVYGSQTGTDPIPGRLWVESYAQYQNGAADMAYWLVTREGYRYKLQLDDFNGIGSEFRANGFGMVNAGTCTSTYQSAEGSASGANGVPLDPSVDYSGAECGDAYKIFFAEPAADLPETSTSARGSEWVLPDSAQSASVSNLALSQNSPSTRAGDISFDLAGINGNYSIAIDVNDDGDFDDPVDRTIPWGSPPGHQTVPFDGNDGQGQAIGLCQVINVKVVADRAGEVHFTFDDVEQMGGGVVLTGDTPGQSTQPELYWDDTALSTSGRGPMFPSADGTAGVDASSTGAHGWPDQSDPWGNVRMIENWSYYAADADAAVSITPPCSPSLTLTKDAQLNDTNGNGVADEGETIDYTFDVENTGDVELDNVHVTDDKVSGLSPDHVDDLQPGNTAHFTADPYTVTAADVRNGTVVNSATATGTPPSGDPVSADGSVTVTTGGPDGGSGSGTGGDGDAALPDTGSPVDLSTLTLAALMCVGGVMLLRRGVEREEAAARYGRHRLG